ncbi:MAG: hypothetical protein WAT39_24000 [Planctomycetota bacterium]
MTLAAVENGMRVEAKAWADQQSLVFAWDNADTKDPHAARTLVWEWRPASQEQLTSHTVRHLGAAVGSIYVPAGTGILAALQLAEGLEARFRGRLYAGGEVLPEIRVDNGGRRGPSHVATVSVPWELIERRIPAGAVGIYSTPGAVAAYQALRDLWETKVRAPLSLPSYFDDSPPAATEPPPWALVGFRLLDPVPLEVGTQRVPGRAIAALNHAPGIGVKDQEAAVDAITRAFHQTALRGVVFGTPSVTRVGRTPVNTWQTNVRLPFHYDVRT